MSDINQIFYKACINKHYDILKYINPQDITTQIQKSMLFKAAISGDIQIFEWYKNNNILLYNINNIILLKLYIILIFRYIKPYIS